MNNLYYTVNKETEYVNGIEETTGNKTIYVYEIFKNEPKVFCEIYTQNEYNSEEEIQNWLDDNGFSDKEFEFINL